MKLIDDDTVADAMLNIFSGERTDRTNTEDVFEISKEYIGVVRTRTSSNEERVCRTTVSCHVR